MALVLTVRWATSSPIWSISSSPLFSLMTLLLGLCVVGCCCGTRKPDLCEDPVDDWGAQAATMAASLKYDVLARSHVLVTDVILLVNQKLRYM